MRHRLALVGCEALNPLAMAAVAERLRMIASSDGREVAFAVWGDPAGFPVLALHGTPGCRLQRWPDENLYRSLGVCVVTHDRAGYGRSSRRRGRSVVDEVDDVRLIADELGFERFGVTGGSGGGPHALACAARLPDRVVRATCAVGITPYGRPGLGPDAWLAGMDPENVREFGIALQGEDVLVPELQRMQAKMEARVAVDPASLFDDFDLGESDRAELARPEMMQIIRESTSEQAVKGVYGWADDDLAFTRPWGFDVAEITVPVLIRYGITDVLVPRAHGEWLAGHVPGCIVKIDDDAGHLGRDPIEEITEGMRWLRDGTAPPGSS
jgi:pimeloyl-ACP methyl ester carboxylesterase